MKMDEVLDELMERAIRAGASDAAVVDSGDIVVEDHLAELCLPPNCGYYGSSAGCPPHVGGPGEMRKRIADADRAIVIKIDIPSPGLLADNDFRIEVFALLSEIAAGIEASALEMGFADASAFSGGGCKRTFCHEHAACRVIGEGGACRHPDRARPSMSGFGVNVGRLMQSAGWEDAGMPGKKAAGDDSFPICAMVLLKEGDAHARIR
jgi:predicted metal-binding protein